VSILSWGSAILTILRILEWMIEKGQERRWIAEGEERAIARGTAEVLRKQRYAQETIKSISSLPDDAVDTLLRELEGPLQPPADGDRK
jgi:hypothetical protein